MDAERILIWLDQVVRGLPAYHRTESFMGDLMGDLNSRRGRVQGMETRGRSQVINAIVPMAEMLNYAPTLKSITGGRGDFHIEFDHYAEVPGQIQEKVIADSKKKAGDGEEEEK